MRQEGVGRWVGGGFLWLSRKNTKFPFGVCISIFILIPYTRSPRVDRTDLGPFPARVFFICTMFETFFLNKKNCMIVFRSSEAASSNCPLTSRFGLRASLKHWASFEALLNAPLVISLEHVTRILFKTHSNEINGEPSLLVENQLGPTALFKPH